MSDNKPNKIIEPSAFDKWWAEVQEWRRQRQPKKHVNDLRDELKRGREQESEFLYILTLVIGGFINCILSIFAFFFSIISFFFSMLFGFIRSFFWIFIIAGIWWGMSSVDDESEHMMSEPAKEFKLGITNFISSISEAFRGLHIEIETKDGEKIEFGTKQPEPPEPPEEPSSE
jgi:hypothetical protein